MEDLRKQFGKLHAELVAALQPLSGNPYNLMHDAKREQTLARIQESVKALRSCGKAFDDARKGKRSGKAEPEPAPEPPPAGEGESVPVIEPPPAPPDAETPPVEAGPEVTPPAKPIKPGKHANQEGN